jgi:hypothetical protein
MSVRYGTVWVLAATLCGSAGCIGGTEQTGEAAHAADSLAASAIAQLDSAELERRRTLEPAALRIVDAQPVMGWTGPGGQPFEVARRTSDPTSGHARRFGTITLRLTMRSRSPDLGQYPCTSCHLGRRMALADVRIADAHESVRPVHPKQTGATCATCHAADNVERLALKSGERATLDQAYRLCAQCHFPQLDDWSRGAHGKRLDGWQGRRVVLGCADCHDPHAPAIEKRIPFRAPRLARTGGGGHEP